MAQDDVLKYFVLPTTQKYSLNCQRGVQKSVNIHIEDAEIKEIGLFFPSKNYD